MTITHPHLLEKAVRAETTPIERFLMAISASFWGMGFTRHRFEDSFARIRADYKRRVQKKGKRAA